MIRPELPANEPARLAALRQGQILDTSPEPAFDDLALLASVVCATRMAAITLIDQDREWFKAAHGMQRRPLARDLAFCAHGIDAERVARPAPSISRCAQCASAVRHSTGQLPPLPPRQADR